MIALPSALKTPVLGLLPLHAARRLVQRQWNAARNLSTTGQPTLYVDVSVICTHDARTGIQRVVRSVLRHLLEHPPAGHRVVAVAASRDAGYRVADVSELVPGHSGVDGAGVVVHPVANDTFLALDLTARILPAHWGLLHRWKRKGVSVQAVVYDLLPVLHPDWFTPQAVRHFRRWLKTLAVFADRMHCISPVVRNDLAGWLSRHLDIQPQAGELREFSLGSDIELGALQAPAASEQEVLAFARRAPTALMVGTIEPRKGHAEVLRAFEPLWQEGGHQQLLVIGAGGWRTDALQQTLRHHPQTGRRLLWVDDASDGLLVALYRAAAGVIVASSGEGLGLPVLEARHFGRPLLVRDLPVFRFAGGSGATYFPDRAGQPSAACVAEWFGRLGSTPVSMEPGPLVSWRGSVLELLQNMGLPAPNDDLARSCA